MKRKLNHEQKNNKIKQKKKTTQIEKINKILELLDLNKSSDPENFDITKKNQTIDFNKDKYNNDISMSNQSEKNNNSKVYKDSESINNLKLKNIKQNIKSGLVDKSFFYNKFENWEKHDKNEFYFADVKRDGNCGYRCIALQLFGSEEKYSKIRENVFNYLDNNRSNYNDYNFEYNGNILSSNDYIDIIQKEGEWMGELEIIAISNIYDINIYAFQTNDSDEIYLINKYGNFENQNKNLLTLCFVNNNHYMVVYEKQNINNQLFENNVLDNTDYINSQNIIKNESLNFYYANDINKTNKFIDIKNFIVNKIKNGIHIYPDSILKIKNKNIKHNKKQNFKRVCKGYDYDFKLNRLIKKINISNNHNKKEYKTYIVAYEFEKMNLIKLLHDKSYHKGINVLYDIVKESKFWWNGIYDDIKSYHTILLKTFY